MKLTKKDIEKYATDEEKKLLEGFDPNPYSYDPSPEEWADMRHQMTGTIEDFGEKEWEYLRKIAVKKDPSMLERFLRFINK